MLGAWLAIGSSLTGGLSDFFGGTTSRQIGTVRFMFASQVIGLVMSIVWVVASGDGLPAVSTLLEAAGAGVAMGVGLGVFLQALVVGTMSIVAPVAAIGVVVPVVAGFAEGNHPAAAQLVGMAAAIIGIVLVSRSSQDLSEEPRESGLRLALISAIGVGIFFWLLASASHHDVPWSLLVVRLVPVIGFGIALRMRGAALRPVLGNQAGPTIIGSALMSFVSIVMYSYSTRHGQLAVVSVLASLFPVVPVVLAYTLLGERVHRIQQLGIVTVLVAVLMIAAG